MTGMRGGHREWLDALARHIARDVGPTPPTSESDAVASDEERLSRATALKLALAGAAALSLGLWNPAPARAQDRGECFTRCLDNHERELKRRLQSCNDVFRPRQYRDSDWRLYAKALFPPTLQLTYAGVSLTGLCYAKARLEVGGDKSDCYDRCEDTCRTRSLQSDSSSARPLAPTCEVAPPRKAPAPEVPTPPNPDNDLCLTCMGQGGECCPGGTSGLCACATAGVPCSAYEGSCA